jgi:hypothetical protein
VKAPGLAALRRLWAECGAPSPGRHRQRSPAGGCGSFEVALPAITLETPAGQRRLERRTLAVEAPPIETVVGVRTELRAGAYTALGHPWIDHVRVAREDGTALAEGTDFSVDRITGRLRSRCDARVEVAYDWGRHRYDVIALDLASGRVDLLRGPDRVNDPNEHIPVLPGGWTALFHVYVNRDFCETVATHEWRGLVRRGEEEAHRAWVWEARTRLPRTMQRLRAGQALVVASYGDSTGALGEGADITAAGGARDTVAFWAGYPEDTLARLDRIDGPLGPGAHTRDGWNWRIVLGLEARYGASCSYRNWCIGGTVIGPETVLECRPGGLDPARLERFLSAEWDLALIQFGGNAIDPRRYGERYSYDCTLTLLEAIRRTGREAIVLGLPRLNPCSSPAFTRAWQRVNRQIVEAARTANVAYVDFAAIAGPGREGGLGLSPLTLGEQNLFNHPGLYEHARYAAYVLEIFGNEG